MVDKIRTEAQYNKAMELIECFITKATQAGGFCNLTKTEAEELEKITLLAEKYEDTILKIMPLPLTISAVLNAKMQEMNISQFALATMLGLGAPKFSQILNGKRVPDVPFLKAVHSKLGVSGDFLLENA